MIYLLQIKHIISLVHKSPFGITKQKNSEQHSYFAILVFSISRKSCSYFAILVFSISRKSCDLKNIICFDTL